MNTESIKQLGDVIRFLENYDEKTATLIEKNQYGYLMGLVNDMTRCIGPRVLTENELRSTRNALSRMIQPRFNNYKMGTKQKTLRIGNATLRVHYRSYLDQKIDEMCAILGRGESIYCSGISSVENKIGLCKDYSRLDPHDLRPEEFILDHWLEQVNINECMADNLNTIYERDLKENVLPDLYTPRIIKAHYHEPYTGKISITALIGVYLSTRINLEKYRDDLFGSNLILRCHTCNKASKSPKMHPEPEPDRYLLPPPPVQQPQPKPQQPGGKKKIQIPNNPP